jgi:hypothetical protein
LVSRLASFSESHDGLDDVRAICLATTVVATKADEPDEEAERRVRDLVPTGVVYLMKSGRYYKIGRSNSAGRRAYELAILLPEPLKLVHAIETDDPPGIERYWHERFADRRANASGSRSRQRTLQPSGGARSSCRPTQAIRQISTIMTPMAEGREHANYVVELGRVGRLEKTAAAFRVSANA